MKRQNYSDRNQIYGCQDLGIQSVGIQRGMRELWGIKEMLHIQTEVGARLMYTFTLKRGNCTVCILYLDKPHQRISITSDWGKIYVLSEVKYRKDHLCCFLDKNNLHLSMGKQSDKPR